PGAAELPPDGRGQEPTGRWRELPGSRRGPPDPALGPGDALAARGGQEARREIHGPAPGQRTDGSLREPRRRCQEARRNPSDGRGQQGLLAFPLLILTYRP